ncbi:hypothetical protein MVES1_000619 [Malassezia vespertilionis]|uniref:Arp9p n=1 Tax=Malassezia vespertilionis TaxID=2020962 RepID=A0A2N1JHD4_9BASI|nr:uncharacterized protein MVES1_000619 [Malassezia vespertilionis]PKI85947.1 hypothetical protein MVES_000571 [Malassezia vespertilionis]WFD05290.1 hypothetical protein MVES1_000619 [Malassezia vespertilionis]
MSREANTLLVVHDAQRIVARVGIQEPFQRPEVDISTRVGRRSAADNAERGAYIFGDALDKAVAADEAIDVIYPFLDGDVQDWDALAALWRHILVDLLHIELENNTLFTMVALPTPISRDAFENTAQIFFEHFNTPALCISEVPLLVAYAVGVLNAIVIDIGLEESSAVPVLDCAVVPTAAVLSRIGIVHCTWWLAYLLSQDEAVVNALRPLATNAHLDAVVYAFAQTLVKEGYVYVDADMVQDGEEYDEGTFDVAAALVQGRERDVIEAHKNNKQSSAPPSKTKDFVHVPFRGIQVPVGNVRTRFYEPLLRPQLLARVTLDIPSPPCVKSALHAQEIGGEPPCVSIPEAVYQATRLVQPMGRRALLWDNLIFTGIATRAQGLIPELCRAFSVFVANDPTEVAQLVGEPNPVQARTIRAHKVPDYFVEFKDRLDLAPLLGATIYAKLVFSDYSGRNFISKMQYNEGGPSVAFAIGSA